MFITAVKPPAKPAPEDISHPPCWTESVFRDDNAMETANSDDDNVATTSADAPNESPPPYAFIPKRRRTEIDNDNTSLEASNKDQAEPVYRTSVHNLEEAEMKTEIYLPHLSFDSIGLLDLNEILEDLCRFVNNEEHQIDKQATFDGDSIILAIVDSSFTTLYYKLTKESP